VLLWPYRSATLAVPFFNSIKTIDICVSSLMI
jgi:hypothetical protein